MTIQLRAGSIVQTDHSSISGSTPSYGDLKVRVRGARKFAHESGRPYRVVVHGLRYFCAKLPGLLADESWGISDRSRHTPLQLAALVNDLRNCNLIFNWGGRIDMGPFLWGARSLGADKIVVFWCGSDVLRAQQLLPSRGVDPWIGGLVHWAASPSLAEEVCGLGLKCEFVQASFVDVVQQPKPLPNKFSVLVFLPRADQGELYGWDRIVEVAEALPHIGFTLVGLHPGEKLQGPRNVSIHYRLQDIRSFYESSTVLWRPVRHDAGISFMVLEALSHGRHVLYTYPVPGAIVVNGSHDAKRNLERLWALNESRSLGLNTDGMAAVARIYSPEVVRTELRRRWEEIIQS